MKPDAVFMGEALRLARKARGKTSPNPMVGAVVCKDGRKVSSGFHPAAGKPHAEVFAIERAGKEASGATLYVNLEPCCHFGRTPPCTDLIIERGIKRVVVGTLDPNPQVGGKGAEKLRQAGIDVSVGVLKERCELLNEAYFKFISTGLPFVTLKLAQTLDGKIATSDGESKWISGEASRRMVHRLRAESDVVLVGRNTVENDDPALTVRHAKPVRSDRPFRVVLDSNLRISPSAAIFAEPKTAIIATSELAPAERERAFRDAGIEVVRTPPYDDKVDISELLRELGRRDFINVLVEGGAAVAWSLVERHLVDKIVLVIAPKILGGRESLPSVSGEGFSRLASAMRFEIHSTRRLGGDLIIVAYPRGA